MASEKKEKHGEIFISTGETFEVSQDIFEDVQSKMGHGSHLTIEFKDIHSKKCKLRPDQVGSMLLTQN